VTGDSIPAVRRVTKEGLGADLPRIRQSAGTASPASECGKKGTHLNAPPIPLGAIARHRHPRGSRALGQPGTPYRPVSARRIIPSGPQLGLGHMTNIILWLLTQSPQRYAPVTLTEGVARSRMANN